VRPEDGQERGDREHRRDQVEGMNVIPAEEPAAVRELAEGDPGALRRPGRLARVWRGAEECAGGPAVRGVVVAGPPAWGGAVGVGVRAVHALLLPCRQPTGGSGCRAY